jgi:hypothetical protein
VCLKLKVIDSTETCFGTQFRCIYADLKLEVVASPVIYFGVKTHVLRVYYTLLRFGLGFEDYGTVNRQ